jgi:hypothetical protein
MSTTCRAAVLLEPNQPLIVDQVDLADPAPDRVLVKLFASGVCHSQIHTMRRPATSCAQRSAVASEKRYPRTGFYKISETKFLSAKTRIPQ